MGKLSVRHVRYTFIIGIVWLYLTRLSLGLFDELYGETPAMITIFTRISWGIGAFFILITIMLYVEKKI